MNANSHSEALWHVLHQAGALLKDGGFAEPVPPLPAPSAGARQAAGQASSEGYDDVAARYGEHLAFGASWPEGSGSRQPRALVLSDAPLSPEAVAFVRTWFENPKVGLSLDNDLFLQPLPSFSGEKPPYPALVRDLCRLFSPKVLFSLGPGPAQKLLGAPLSLDTLRGSDYRFDRWTMVTTLDPELFGSLDEPEKPPFKAQVWRDLQRLLGKLKYG